MTSRVISALNDAQKLGDDGNEIELSLQITPLDFSVVTSFLSSVLFKVSFINGLFDENLSVLLNLVVVDNHTLAFKVGSCQALLCLSCLLWVLKANKCKVVAILAFVHSDAFNVTELAEELSNLVVLPVIWEVFDIKIASFLRVLVPKNRLLLFKLSVSLLKSRSDVQLLIFNLLVIQSFNCLLSALGPILSALAQWILKADKAELANLILHQH